MRQSCAATVSVTPDFDRDGIPDVIDEDDDNDELRCGEGDDSDGDGTSINLN